MPKSALKNSRIQSNIRVKLGEKDIGGAGRKGAPRREKSGVFRIEKSAEHTAVIRLAVEWSIMVLHGDVEGDHSAFIPKRSQVAMN